MIQRSVEVLVLGLAVCVAVLVSPAGAQESSEESLWRGSSPALDQLKAGLGSMNAGEFAEAYRHFELALERASTSELRYQASLGMGTAAASLERFDDAEAAYEAALGIKPNDSATLYSMGLLAKQQGQFEDAATLFARAAVRDPKLGAAFAELGVVYAYLGRHEDSADACWRAVAVDPDDLDAMLCLGVARYHLARYPEALQAFEAILESEPENTRAIYGVGLAKLYQEDRDGALAQVAELEKLDSKLASELYDLIYPPN